MSTISNLDGVTQDFKLDNDRKREVDHRRKYHLGVIEGPHKDKPMTPQGQRSRRNDRLWNQKPHGAHVAHLKHVGKHPALHDDTDALTSDSSADEYSRDASPFPVPDADITYSFDAPRGPAHGSEILSMAINKAVERFENKATETLIRDEYEVVAKDIDGGHDGYTADEDDFELV